MNNEKTIKAEMLLEGIGEIDDTLLAEALAYRPRRRAGSRLVILAATVAVFLTIMMGLGVIGRLADEKKGDSVAPEFNDAPQAPAQTGTLDSFLSSIEGGDGYEYLADADTLPYFDGMAHVVWQYSGDGGYYVSEGIEGEELESLKVEIGCGYYVGAESPELNCRVWVLLGDGRVISPYLVATSGNISTEVFDYEPEIIPSEEFVTRIQGILS